MVRGLKRQLLLRLWAQLFQLRLQKHLTTELPHLYFLPNVTEIQSNSFSETYCAAAENQDSINVFCILQFSILRV